MSETLRLTLFGSPRILLGDQQLTGFIHNKSKALLFYLAVTGQPHSRDALATLLWHEMTDAQAKNNLRSLLPEVRRLLGDHVLIERQTVTFHRNSHYWLDVEVLRRSLTPVRAVTDLVAQQAAVDLYQGEFLSGFYVHNAPAFDAWLLEQREQLHAIVIEALAALVNTYTQQGDAIAALAVNRRLLFLEPWSEPVHRQQMILLAQTGARSAALAQYETCRTILATEFGIAPLPETTMLYEQIRGGQFGNTNDTTITAASKPSAQQAGQITQPSEPVAAGQLPQVTVHNLPQSIKLYGRQPELAQLKQWLGAEGCQLIGILGIGGQGKTALAATLLRTLAERSATLRTRNGDKLPDGQRHFTHIIWQSLLNAPPLAEVIQNWIYVISNQTVTSLPTSLDQQFKQLIGYLQEQPCLLVLDNLESILQGDGHSGYYRPGYEPYGQLIHYLVTNEHRSSLLFTSRECPHDLVHLEEDTASVRFLPLAGLPAEAGRQMIAARGMVGAMAELTALVQHYSGNPLALKLVADTVYSLFDGDIAAFLHTETLVFDDIREVLDQQFTRLTALERELLIWLAILREPVPYPVLRTFLAQPPAGRLVVEAMRSLQRRSLLEKYETGFGLQNVVLEYTTALLVERIYGELTALDAAHRQVRAYLNRYALLLAQAKDYVRASQTRLLLQPVAAQLVAQFGRKGAEHQLQRLVTDLHTVPATPGYAAANLLHLLLQIGVKLDRYDFSQLTVRQADLRGVSLPQVTFAGADLTGTHFTEPLGRILTVVFSPDGRLLTAGTRDGAIHVWRMADQQLAQVIHAHDHAIINLTFASHSTKDAHPHLLLASAGEDQTVGAWQLAKEPGSQGPPGARLRRRGELLRGHQHTVIGVGFNADQQHLASVDTAGNVQVWALATGQAIAHFNCQLPKFRVATFTQDGYTLAIGNSDGAVYLWQITGVPGLILAGHTRDVTAIAFSPDGRLLASGSGDGRICLWSLPQGQLQQVLDAAAGIVPALVFSPDGQSLASSHWDRAVRVWSIHTGQLRHTMVGHTHVIQSVAFSPAGHLLASGGSDQTVRVWDPQTGQPLYTLRGHHSALNAVALSTDGTKLAAVGYDQLVHLWQWHDTHNGTAHRALPGHLGLLHTVTFSPDGRTVASAGRDAAIHLWTVDSGELRDTLYGHAPDIYRVAFHPDGHLLASGSADGTVRLWDLRTLERKPTDHSQCADTLHANEGMAIYTLAFSPDGRILASAGIGPIIRLWDMTQPHRPELLAARKLVQEVNEREILAVAFSPDGTKLAASGTNLIHIWDLASGELRTILHQHIDWVMGIAFSPDGATLASASEDRTICLWDVGRGTLQSILHGHQEGVYSVSFSADGNTVLSGSADGTIKCWDRQTGTCLNTLVVDGPYAKMNIRGATGITDAQKTALKALGAVEE